MDCNGRRSASNSNPPAPILQTAMTTDLWIATGNPKKRDELERMLQPLGYELRLQSEAPGHLEVVEDRPDFAGNAAKKALALAALVAAPTIADDSGLSVDALGGRPGVHSARYAGKDATDTDRIQKLLAELGDTQPASRTARFTCNICLVGADGEMLAQFEESCEGIIRNAPRGEQGFGYDPVFVPLEFFDPDTNSESHSDTTFAELTPQQKDSISHRGKALRALEAWLRLNPIQ